MAIKQSETPVTHWPTAAATSQHLRFEWVSVTDFRALCLISRQVAVLWLSSVSSFLEWKTASSNISRCRRLIKSFTLRSSSAVFIKYRCYRQMPSELRRCLGKWGVGGKSRAKYDDISPVPGNQVSRTVGVHFLENTRLVKRFGYQSLRFN